MLYLIITKLVIGNETIDKVRISDMSRKLLVLLLRSDRFPDAANPRDLDTRESLKANEDDGNPDEDEYEEGCKEGRGEELVFVEDAVLGEGGCADGGSGSCS